MTELAKLNQYLDTRGYYAGGGGSTPPPLPAWLNIHVLGVPDVCP